MGSDLGLHCFPKPYEKETKFILVNLLIMTRNKD